MSKTPTNPYTDSLSDNTKSPFLKQKKPHLESFYKGPPASSSSDPNLGKVIYISLCFLILFTAFNGAQALTAEIYEQLHYKSLGKVNQVTLYAVFCIASLITPALIKNWGYKNGVSLASLGFFCTLLAGAFTCSCSGHLTSFLCHKKYIYTVNIVAASVNGLCGPVLWSMVNRYITSCTNEHNKGKYFGIFSGAVFAASVAGSALGAVVIKIFGQFGFYLTCCFLSICATIMMFMAPNVPKYGEVGNENILEKINKMGKLAVSRSMRPLILFFFLVGFLLAVYYGFEYEIILNAIPTLSKDDQNYETAKVMFVEGLMTVVAGYSAGKLSDVWKRTTVMIIYALFSAFAIIATYFSYIQASLPLAYLMAVLWGTSYSGLYTLAGVTIAKDFEGGLEAYGIFNFMSTFATSVGFAMCVYVHNVELFLTIVGGLVMMTLVSIVFYKQKEVREEEGSKIDETSAEVV